MVFDVLRSSSLFRLSQQESMRKRTWWLSSRKKLDMSKIHMLLFLVWIGVERVQSECPVLSIPNAIISSINDSNAEFTTECETGYYNTSGDTLRTCINDIWSGTDIVCEVVDCGNIPLASEMLTFYNSTVFGSKVVYLCPSGYTRGNGKNTVVYACESSGQWNSTDIEAVSCSRRLNTYYGCFDESLFQATNQSFEMVFDCVNYCRHHGFSFGGMMIEECYCSDDIALETERTNSMCDTPCSYGRFICGGQGVVSTHITYAGCYSFAEAITLEFQADGNVLQLTCVEICRGIRKKFAIYINDRCSCKDGFDVAVAVSSSCESATFIDTIEPVDSAFIMTVAKTRPIYRDCDALYQAGIRRHGIYILQDGTNVSCHFKDGTICPTSWLGNGGFCYYFDTTKRSPEEALQNCLKQNSFLLSIESQDEDDFLSDALNTFFDFEENEWLMGLYGMGVQHRMFPDGSLTLYHSHVPQISTLDRNCTVLRKKSDGGFAWTPRDCGDITKNSICKKAKGQVCTTIDPVPESTFTRTDMTLTWCLQACGGADFLSFATKNDSCYCLNDLSGPSLPWINCDITCPGNHQQRCGGKSTSEVIVFASAVDKLLAKSCQELEFNGVKGGMFKLSYPNGTTRTQFCSDSSCPPSWITINDHCYKFISADDTGVNSCPQMVAYDVVIDSDEEIEGIRLAIGNIEHHRVTQNNWKIGLFDFADNGFYRWFNGRYMEEKYSALGTEYQGGCLGFNHGNEITTFVPVNCKYAGLICEKGSEYLGAYSIPNKTAEIINVDMSIMLCVETCRVLNNSLAMISQMMCWCDNILPPTANKTDRQFCYLKGQPCGSEFTTDVYSVGSYPSLALSCDDLFNQGIFISGLYMINGTPTNCQFIDNNSGVEYEDWVYVHGDNFRPIHSEVQPSQYDDTCKLYGGVPASLSTLDQYNTILQLIKSSKLGINELILVGLSDQFERGQFSWSDGSLFRHLPWLFSVSNTKSKFAAINTSSGYLTNSISDTANYAMLCMKEKDYIGCFGEENNVLDSYIVLRNYKSMTVSQCQQLCYKTDVPGDVYSLVSINNCYCIYDFTVINGHLTSVNSTLCDMPCPGNNLQKCGFPGFVRAYFSDSIKAASTCRELHANGVMVKEGYTMLLQNGTLIREQCSFTENSTACDIGWIQFNNTCFWPEPQSKLPHHEASRICLSKNSVLATVRDTDDIAFFRTLIRTTPPWENLTLWHTGISDALNNGRFVLPNGLQYNTDGFAWLDSNTVTKKCGALDISTGYLEWIDCLENLPFICQKDKYMNCEASDQLPTYAIGIDSSFNIQQCVEICRTINNTARIGLDNDTCYCYEQPGMFPYTSGVCDTSCQVYNNQPCGSTIGDVRTVIEFGIYDDLSYSSCDELLMYGINFPHLYFFILNGTTFDTTCFDKGVHFNPLLGMDNGSLTASTERSLLRGANEARLYRLNKQSAWRPKSTDTNPWIEATFLTEYLLSAVSVKGFVGSNRYWCPVLDISYDDILSAENPTSYISLGQFTGNNDSSTVVTHYFNPPMVAKSLHISGKNSEHGPVGFGLRFEIYGEPYGTFVHSDRYIGCFGLVDNYVLDTPMVSVNKCRENCSEYPFYGIAQDELNNETCYCLNRIGKYGILYGDLCQNCIECNYNVGSFAKHSIAVYRTYNKECTADLPVVGNTTTTIVPGYNHVDVYGFGTVIAFDCEVGHEYPDGETGKNMYCYNNNTWNPQLDSCQLKMCPEPGAPINGMIEGSNYNFNFTIEYVCNPGYEFSTGAESYLAVCQNDKTWSSIPKAVCQRMKCSSPPVVVNTETVADVYYFEDVITYTCKEYTRFPDNTTKSTSQCSTDGSWTPIETCSFYTCPPPPVIQGAFRSVDDENAVYNCYRNHFFSDGSTNKSVTCNEEFLWLINDTCTIPVELFSPKHSFCQSRNGVRRIATSMITLTARSRLDCALICAQNDLCMSYNQQKEGSRLCEILLSPLDGVSDTNDPAWIGFNAIDRLPC